MHKTIQNTPCDKSTHASCLSAFNAHIRINSSVEMSLSRQTNTDQVIYNQIWKGHNL